MPSWMAPAAAAALAVAAAPAAAQTPAPSPQQQFESAAAAVEGERWAEALALFEALEARLASGSPRSLAIVRVRKAEALVALGRDEEAERSLRLGLPALPAGDASLAEDRYLAYVKLGEIAERALDYGEALQNYRAAEPLATGIGRRFRMLRGLIQTGLFYDAPAALAEADRALAASAAENGGDRLEATLRELRARVLLNLGRPGEARRELKRATELLGGLTRKVDAADLAVRSDLAIAALLDGDEEEARKYIAWTGAGKLKEMFRPGFDMTPPPCDEDLRPGDVAVVELSIRQDGTVGHSTPIYSSRQGPSALAFARAVTGWSWTPEQLTGIQPLFRLLTRIELRCSNAPDRPSIRRILGGDLRDWLIERDIAAAPAEGQSDARRLKPLQEELARREESQGVASPALLPVLAELALNDLVARQERRAYFERAHAIAAAAKAPAPVLAWLRMELAEPQRDWGRRWNLQHAAALRALLDQPDLTADPRAATAIRIALADALNASGRAEDAVAALEAVKDTPGLGPANALRAAALARLASLKLALDKPDEARLAFAESGLTADQCALVDAPPQKKAGSWSFRDFPLEALRWGFEGWAKIEYDISPQGVPRNVRPTVAYPPFVFGKAAAKILERQRYEESFRPGGSLGCGGQTTTVQFVLPH
jgi:tetratricopeptide (TPR) repeat protein